MFRAPRLPAGGCPGVDHVVVGPSGGFVIDSQRWTGTVQVRRDVLRRRGRLRKKALGGATRAALKPNTTHEEQAVADLLDEPRQHLVKPVVCFARDERIMGWGRRVMVCSSASLVSMLLTQATVLGEDERATLCADLALRFRAAAVAPGSRPPRGGGHRAVPADPSSPAGRLVRLLG